MQFFEEDFIDIDQPCATEEFVILEKLEPSENKEVFNNILDSLTFNLCLLFLTMLCCLVAYIVVKIQNMQKFVRIMKRRPFGGGTSFKVLLKKFFVVKWSFAYTLSTIGIFLLFFDIQIFFIKLFVTNNIKTNKVLYDTSNIIKDAEDALSTSKVFPEVLLRFS